MNALVGSSWSRRMVACCGALALLVVSTLAWAAGRVQWTSTNLKEREDKAWKLEVAVFFSKPPDVPHVPVKFEFQQTVYFERSLVDDPGNKEGKLVERKVPIENKQASIETVDIGFLDPSTGKVESRTKFSFKVTRGHGYEAGEYRVTIRDARDGSTIGTPTRIVFDGENDTVDRRTMTFSGGDAKPKKKQMKEVDHDGNVEGDKAASGTPNDTAGGGDGEPAASAEPAAADPEPAPADAPEEAKGPPPIKEKPGGCGCRMDGRPAPAGLPGVLALVVLGAVAARRRAA